MSEEFQESEEFQVTVLSVNGEESGKSGSIVRNGEKYFFKSDEEETKSELFQIEFKKGKLNKARVNGENGNELEFGYPKNESDSEHHMNLSEDNENEENEYPEEEEDENDEEEENENEKSQELESEKNKTNLFWMYERKLKGEKGEWMQLISETGKNPRLIWMMKEERKDEKNKNSRLVKIELDEKTEKEFIWIDEDENKDNRDWAWVIRQNESQIRFNTRLDSLARILEARFTCASVFIIDQIMYVTTNSSHISQRIKSSKKDTEKNQEKLREDVNYLIKFMINLLKMKDNTLENLMEKDSEFKQEVVELLLKNYIGKKAGGEKKSAKTMTEEEKGDVKQAIELLLTNKIYEKFDSIFFIKNEREKLAQIRKFANLFDDLYRDVRDFKNVCRYFNQKDLSQIADCRVIVIEGKKVHTEMRSLSYLLRKHFSFKDEKFTLDKNIYFGISKLCCPKCKATFLSVNEKLLENSEHFITFRGSHKFSKEDWPKPSFLQGVNGCRNIRLNKEERIKISKYLQEYKKMEEIIELELEKDVESEQLFYKDQIEILQQILIEKKDSELAEKFSSFFVYSCSHKKWLDVECAEIHDNILALLELKKQEKQETTEFEKENDSNKRKISKKTDQNDKRQKNQNENSGEDKLVASTSDSSEDEKYNRNKFNNLEEEEFLGEFLKSAYNTLSKHERKDAKNVKTYETPVRKIKVLDINVPSDGTCLFYSVVLGYLLPVLNDYEKFAQRYQQLFLTEKEEVEKEVILNLMEILKKFDGDEEFISKEETGILETLINVNFREKVVAYMEKNNEKYQEKLLLDRQFDNQNANVTKEDFEKYLEGMKTKSGWGGLIEITAISELLGLDIVLYQLKDEKDELKCYLDWGDIKNNSCLFLLNTYADKKYKEAKNHYHILLEPQYLPVNVGVNKKSSSASKKKQSGIMLTKGDGNCFFHAVFGKFAENQEMVICETAGSYREKWHETLSEYKYLLAENMPGYIKKAVSQILLAFLDNPNLVRELKDNKLMNIVAETNKLRNQMERKCADARQLVYLNIKFGLLAGNQVFADILVKILQKEKNYRYFENVEKLKEFIGKNQIETKFVEENAEKLLDIIGEECLKNMIHENQIHCFQQIIPNFQAKDFDIVSFLEKNFLSKPELYECYVNVIKSSNYYIFTEEIPMLANLFNVTITLRRENAEDLIIKPEETNAETKVATIYHEGVHYSMVNLQAQNQISKKTDNKEENIEEDEQENAEFLSFSPPLFEEMQNQQPHDKKDPNNGRVFRG